MRKYLLLITTLFYSAITFAENKPFDISGSIIGAANLKYAYVFDNEEKLIAKTMIQNNTFVLSGIYNTVQRFGEPAFLNLLLSNAEGTAEVILADRALSVRRYNHCKIFCEEKINVSYSAESKIFNIQGNHENKIQNKFHELDISFLSKRDSSNNSIDRLELSEIEKTKLKNKNAMAIFKELTAQRASLILNNPDSEVSLLNFLRILFDLQFSAKETSALFEHFSNRVKNTEYWIHVQKDVKDKLSAAYKLANPAYAIGMTFPAFSLKNSNDKDFNSNTISNKFTLIDFWATWCVPCRKETPNLIKSYKAYGKKGFQVITISVDEVKDQAKWAKVLEEDKMNDFTNLFNGGDLSGLASKLGVMAIPTNYLIDNKGKIIAMNLRGDQLFKFLSTRL